MKTLRVFFVVLFAFSSNTFAQEGPIVLAQAGGPSRGAGAPAAASTGIGTTLAAVTAAIIAAAAAAGTSNSTVTAPSHH